MRLLKLAAPLALVLSTVPAQAAVNEALPKPPNSSEGWHLAADSLMSYNYERDELTLETNSGGVWFGSYSPGSNASGNAVSITARFSPGSRDWSTYLADGSYFAGMLFGPGDHTNPGTGEPKDCDAVNCYEDPYTEGVSLSFASAFNSHETSDLFIDLDMQIDHEFGFLLKDGLVAYTVDGRTYSGYAQTAHYSILVIGDGSGSTHTGLGSMTLSAVSFDTAPEGNVTLSAAPEPASWAMMLGGFGLIGGALRSRRRMALAQ